MNEPSREEPVCGPRHSRVLGWMLILALPRERREELWGDLLEEAHHRRSTGRDWICVWLWLEVFRSLPWLFGRRLQRAFFEARAPVVGVVSGTKAEGTAFAAFLGGTRMGGGRHPLSMGVSLALHLGVLVAGVGWALWRVDEVDPPRIPVVLNLPHLPDVNAGDLGRPSPAPKRPEKRRPPRPRPPRAAVLPAQEPARVAAEEPGTASSATESSGSGEGPGETSATPCAGPGCNGGSRALPAELGERRCLSCPPPRLPPALLRLGLDREMLVRICVDTAGNVSKVTVLRGLGGGFDGDAVESIRRWRFAPLYLGKHPVPFCFPTRFIFKIQ